VEGAVDMQVDGGEVVRVSTGEVFTETPDNVHTMNNNASATEQARFIAFIIKDADKAVVLPANPAVP
jgi:quercetin dioxygenase-like cupin family protein